MSLSLTFREFALAWLPSFLAVATAPPPLPQLGEMFIVDLAGVPVPVATCLFAILGIGLSRPLARTGEAQLGIVLFSFVTVIMLVLVLLWIIETRPSWLYAFVVSIGLGFAGYSLIELFGEKVKGFVSNLFDNRKGGQ